jgi:stress response protein SCP2
LLLQQEAELRRKETAEMPPVFNDLVLSVMPGTQLRVGLSWDFFQGLPKVDLDVAAVIYDNLGMVVDAAFYNNRTACNGAIMHSGDNKDGAQAGIDECVTINFAGLPLNVSLVMLSASAYSGGSFSAVETAAIALSLDPNAPPNIISLGQLGNKTSVVLCALFRRFGPNGAEWVLRMINGATDGKNFQDCKQMMQVYVDMIVGKEMANERKTLGEGKVFNMKKGDEVDVPGNLSSLRVGLGWTDMVDNNLDLDGSIILVDTNGTRCEMIFYGNKRNGFITHSGDNRTGVGSGDDEVINVELSLAPSHVRALFITVTVFSGT